MRVGVVVHAGRPEAVKAASDLVAWCRERGIGTRVLDPVEVGADERGDGNLGEGVDLVVSVGGDGTLLRGALMAARAEAPVLGVNVGRLGFLTEAEPEEMSRAMEAFTRGELEVETRMALVAEVEGVERLEPMWALNEVAVEKATRHRLATLSVTVGGDHVTTFSADAVIVATPTGSTAYSFSAGGPIVSPNATCLILTPVAPHMVFNRPLVLAPEATVELEVAGDEPAVVSADGRPAVELPVGCRVRVRRSERPARLLRRRDSESFYAKLRRRFSLPEGPPGSR